MVGVPVIDTGPMTVEEFYAFTDTRPDEEKWELIDGEPILNAAPSRMHQLIIRNVIFALGIRERELNALGRCCHVSAFASPILVGRSPTSWSFLPIIVRSILGSAMLAT